MTRVKICGLSRLEHATAALDAGADMIGFVFAESRRKVDPYAAAEIIRGCRVAFPADTRSWQAVGVFANQPLEEVQRVSALCALDVIQLSGEEPPDYGRALALPHFRTVHLPPGDAWPVAPSLDAGSLKRFLAETTRSHGSARIVLDTGHRSEWGGTGVSFDWYTVGSAAAECIVAGGLSPANVSSAIGLLAPWGVDVSSGVEESGSKNVRLIRQFVEEVRKCDAHAVS